MANRKLSEVGTTDSLDSIFVKIGNAVKQITKAKAKTDLGITKLETDVSKNTADIETNKESLDTLNSNFVWKKVGAINSNGKITIPTEANEILCHIQNSYDDRQYTVLVPKVLASGGNYSFGYASANTGNTSTGWYAGGYVTVGVTANIADYSFRGVDRIAQCILTVYYR